MSNEPILAVIAEHQRIYKAWRKATRTYAHNHEIEPLFDLYVEVSDRLFQTTPTTIAGILALLDYVIDKHNDIGHWGACGVDFAGSILSSIREGLITVTKDDLAV